MQRQLGRMGGNAPVLLWVVLGLVVASFVLLVVALATTTTGWAWGSVAASAVAGALLGAEWIVRRRSAPSPVDADTDPLDVGDRFATDTATAAAVQPAGVPRGGGAPAGSSGEPPDVSRTDVDTVEGADRGRADDGADDDGADDGGATTGTDQTEPEPDGPAVAPEPPARELDSDRQALDSDRQALDTDRQALDSDRREFYPDGRELDRSAEPAEERTDVGDAIAIADLPDEVRVIDERPRYHLGGCRWVGARETLPLPVSEARELGFTPCAVCRPDATLAARSRAART